MLKTFFSVRGSAAEPEIALVGKRGVGASAFAAKFVAETLCLCPKFR
jgi:hypothetical protein